MVGVCQNDLVPQALRAGDRILKLKSDRLSTTSASENQSQPQAKTMRSPFKKNKLIASHPPQQKAIAHFSKTNPITLRTNHSTIASLLPQEKRPFQQNKPDRLPNQPQHDRISPTSTKRDRRFSREHQNDRLHRLLPCCFSTDTLNPAEQAIAFLS
jgi:hypothetical protein